MCKSLTCRFNQVTMKWEGYCPHLNKKVYNDSDCGYNRQLDLFDNVPNNQYDMP